MANARARPGERRRRIPVRGAREAPRTAPEADGSPPAVAIGHVVLRVADTGRADAFYRTLGLRPVVHREELAILELRGGTHLVLFRSRGRPKAGPVRSFDFMVEDLDAMHAAVGKAGIRPSAIGNDELAGHRWFEVTDPDGHVLRVFSSHTQGRPV